MAQWGDGYITDLPYLSGFFRETTPNWLAMVALLQGQRPPDLARPFRYADLGCGTGFTATVVAATQPNAEVWGFDFNPAHIETATRLAAAANLPNLLFREASFADLVALPEQALPPFDVIVCHGVLTHVSAENRRLLFQLINRLLKPGGLAYLGYNVAAGWAAMAPVRVLMRALAAVEADAPHRLRGSMLDSLARLRSVGAHFFRDNPAVGVRLEAMRQQNPHYLAHEYLGEAWHPMTFAEVSDAMAEAKCSFIGSATLVENIDLLSVPSGCLSLLRGDADTREQEMLRDMARAQTFRRDIYRRGIAPLSPGERAELRDALVLSPLGWNASRPVTVDSPIGTLSFGQEVYRPVIEALAGGPTSLGRIRDLASRAGATAADGENAATLLAAAGCLHPTLPDGVSRTARTRAADLNRALILSVAAGGELTQLAAPTIGAALVSDVVEMLLVQLLLEGTAATVDALSDALRPRLLAVDPTAAVGTDAKRLAEPGNASLSNLIGIELQRRAPLLRRLGVLNE